jgi:phosphatidylserine/phosphatidylglycerophosphate/cardiolipin synthase-like enzyme
MILDIRTKYSFVSSMCDKKNMKINKKKKNPEIQIDVYTNNNFNLNPIKVVDTKISINPYKIKLDNNYKKLAANDINIHYLNDHYTHNKISIFDKKDILFGSMNIADRSLKKDKDTELCIYIENNPELCSEILGSTHFIPV